MITSGPSLSNKTSAMKTHRPRAHHSLKPIKNVASVTNLRLLLVKTKHLEQIYYSWFYKPSPSYQNLGKAIKRLVFGKFDLIILKALASWAEVVVECLWSERTQFESRHRQRALLL